MNYREEKKFRFGQKRVQKNNGNRFNANFKKTGFSPVKEGEELNAVIEAVAEKGDGIAKKSGFVIFVPGTKVGDKVKIKIKKVAKKVAFADIIGNYEEINSNEEMPQEEETEDEEEYDSSQDSEEF